MSPNPWRGAPQLGPAPGTVGGSAAQGWQQTLRTTVLKMRAAVSQDQAPSPREAKVLSQHK